MKWVSKTKIFVKLVLSGIQARIVLIIVDKIHLDN
jgi:hypothetical protein